MTSRAIPAADLNTDDMYLLLRDAVMPRPIAWVSTIDHAGRTNLAPYSFFNVVSPNPPVLGFSVGPRNERRGTDHYEPKDTLINIRETGDFVVNIVPERFMDQMVRSSDPLPHWRAAEQAAQDALRVYTPEQMPYYHEKATHLLIDIRAEIARLGG